MTESRPTETPDPLAPAHPPNTGAVIALLGGILLFMLGCGLLGNEINSISWRLKALTYYQRGLARLEKTEVFRREGSYDVEMTFHLEWEHQVGRSTARLDLDDPSAPTMEDARKRQSLLIPGQLYPCWYWPENPQDYNIFAPDGLRLGLAFLRLGLPAIWLFGTWLLCRWAWRKLEPPAGKSSPGRVPHKVSQSA